MKSVETLMKAPEARLPLQILAIDTSTEACSAALSLRDGTMLLRFQLTERSHADLILPMVDELLTESKLKVAQLDGLAFGRGPGGFTGLRVAAGVIQGLAYGAGLRVAPVSSLAAVAYQALKLAPVDHARAKSTEQSAARGAGVLVCNDARMNEVYWACYFDEITRPAAGPSLIGAETVGPSGAIAVPPGCTRFAGNAFTREPQLRSRLEAMGLEFAEGIYPRADAVAMIGAEMVSRGETVRPEDAVPVYVRDNVARATPKAPVTVV